VLVVGVGNELRRDDAAGLEVARRARAMAMRRSRDGVEPAIAFREHEGETLGLLEAWEGAGAVILADALHGGGAVGTVHRLDASNRALPAHPGGSSSTHAIGVADAIELGRILGRLPPRVVVYAVTGRRFEAGRGLSPELQDMIDTVARRVLAEAWRLAQAQRPGGPPG
jgi:hydrogenase maturation protease